MALGLIGKLYYEIEAHSGKFDQSVAESTKKAKEFEASWNNTAQSLQTVGGKMTMFLTLPIVGLGAAMLKGASDMENYQTGFTTLLGSGEKAAAMLSDLKKFAAVTPFGFADLAKSTQTLLGFGQTAESIMPTIKTLGDVAMGNKDKFQQLSLVYAQIMSTGKLMGQDLLQLINAGFNPLTIIAQQTGKSVAQLKDEMAKGAISADMVAAAFKSATSEGGLFFGGMEKASQTLSGQWSTLMDDIGNLGNQFGEILIPIAKDVIKQISSLVASFGTLDDGTKKMIITVAGVAALSGPLTSAVGGVMNLVNSIGKIPGPALIAIGAIAAVVGIVVAWNAAMKEGTKTYADRLAEENKNVSSLMQQYKTLAEKTNLTTEEEKKRKQIQDELIKLSPELTKCIDDETGKLELNDTAIKNNNISRAKKLDIALQEAIQLKQADIQSQKRGEAEIEAQKNNLKTGEITQKQFDEWMKGGPVVIGLEKELADLKVKELQASKDLWALQHPEDQKTLDAYKEKIRLQKELNEGKGITPAGNINTSFGEGFPNDINAQTKFNRDMQELYDQDVKNKEKAEEEKAAAIKKTVDDTLSFTASAVSQIASIVAMGYQNELTEVDNRYKHEQDAQDETYQAQVDAINNSTLNEKDKNKKLEALDKDKAAKDKELAKKKAAEEAEIKKKAFEANKAASIISAVISGVQAVMTSFAQFGWPWGLIPAGIMAAITAAQVATIAAQPVPAFAQSGTVFPSPGGSFIRAGDNNEPEHIMGDSQFRKTMREELGASGGGITQTNNFYGDINSDVDMDRHSQAQARKMKLLLRAS
jgi:tape measure domain-containing protein